MNGVIFEVFEAFATESFGPAVYDEILEACPVAGLAPDAQVSEVIAVACRWLGVAPQVLLRRFGRFAFHELVARRPELLDVDDPLAFLHRVGELIDSEGAEIVSIATRPSVRSQRVCEGALRIELRAPPGWCAVFEGMLDGVADVYCTQLHQRHGVCVHDGAASCVFEVVRESPAFASAA